MPADRAPSVLITGIHSELGFAVSHRFRREGWFVIGCDHGTTTGRNARVHISADLTQETECARTAARASALGNGIDCIVNCADVRLGGPVDEFGSQAWDVMMAVNAKSVFLLSTAAMPYLEETHGAIVVVAPEPDGAGEHEHAVYDASRAAVVGLATSLATELAPRDIHVHLVTSQSRTTDDWADVTAEQVWSACGFPSGVHAHSH
jgi:NAD(P)-dependent dehydrogenase (short-subunit alcohol dehydrogenase family)